MKIRYFHNIPVNKLQQYYTYKNKQFGTIALSPPDEKQLAALVQNTARSYSSDFIMMTIGASFLHHEDQFCRKTGRVLATSRLAPIPFHLSSIEFIKEGGALKLIGVDNILKVRYTVKIKVYADSKKVRFTRIETEGI